MLKIGTEIKCDMKITKKSSPKQKSKRRHNRNNYVSQSVSFYYILNIMNFKLSFQNDPKIIQLRQIIEKYEGKMLFLKFINFRRGRANKDTQVGVT